VNEDALQWAEAWNAHKLQIRGEGQHSPRELYLFGMVRQGPRGIERFLAPVGEDVEDVGNYGVDWEVADDEQFMEHLLDNNPQEWEDENPFTPATMPGKLSEVICDPPNCPLLPQQVQILNRELAHHFDLLSRNMQYRRLLWVHALSTCSQLWGEI
jgi:hypothetical protein